MNRNEYQQRVREIADELVETAKSGELEEGADAREAFLDLLWEKIDSTDLVIYTYKAKCVVCNSDNDGYAIEQFGIETAVQDGAINWSALAFGALYADVLDQLDRVDGFDINDPNPETD